MIWKKGNHTTGFPNANRMPLKNHESVLVFYKKLPKYYPQDLILLDKPVYKKSTDKKLKIFGKRNNESLNKVHVTKYTNYPKSIIDFLVIAKRFTQHKSL